MFDVMRWENANKVSSSYFFSAYILKYSPTLDNFNSKIS
jgi:hypothetical protein